MRIGPLLITVTFAGMFVMVTGSVMIAPDEVVGARLHGDRLGAGFSSAQSSVALALQQPNTIARGFGKLPAGTLLQLVSRAK